MARSEAIAAIAAIARILLRDRYDRDNIALILIGMPGLEKPRQNPATYRRKPHIATDRPGHQPTSQYMLYGQRMLTIASRLDVMNRLGRAMADPTRSRILLMLLAGPSYPVVLARELELTRSNVSNHLTCLRDCGIVVAEPEGRRTRYEIADPHLTQAMTALVEVTLAVDKNAPCMDGACTVPGCCQGGSAA